MHKPYASLLLGTVLAACGTRSTDTVIVTPSSIFVVDNADAIAWEGGFIWAAANAVDPTVAVDVDAAAAAAAHDVPGFFTPASCVSASAAANVMTLQLAGCSGPFTQSEVSGTVMVSFTPAPSGVQLAVASNFLLVSGAILIISTQSLLTGSGEARTLAVTTDGNGVGPNGTSVVRQGQYTISWMNGDACAAIDGNVGAGGGTVNAQQTNFRAFTLCTSGCPRSGVVTLFAPKTGATVITTYNGTSTVVVSANGQQTLTGIDCQ
jgi:hypothetical protein